MRNLQVIRVATPTWKLVSKQAASYLLQVQEGVLSYTLTTGGQAPSEASPGTTLTPLLINTVTGNVWVRGTGRVMVGEFVNPAEASLFTSLYSVLQQSFMVTQGGAVSSVNGQIGEVSLTFSDVGAEESGAAATAESNAKAYADTLVLGLLDDRGNYDPTDTSAYPTTGGSGASGAILKGDLWAISADGNVNGIAVTVGDTIRALVDAPAQNNTNWAITQNNLIYVPENSSNKATSLALPNDTKYPTTQAVATALEGYATVANQRYQFLNDSTTTLTTYTVPASAVTENGRTIIELSNNSLTSITVDTNTGTGKIAGDSVNISITGTYAAQVLVASGVTLQGDLAFSYQHQTKTLVYKGSNTWKIVG